MKTREEHLQWRKERALEYADRGDLLNAVTSMGCNPYLLIAGVMDAQNGNREAVRQWILGFR